VSHCVVAHIDLDALQHNLKKVREYAPKTNVLAMIKANGYGHGLLTVASALDEADALGVARMHEAVQLRKAGVKTPIVLMEGFIDAEELPLLAEYDLGTVIHSEYQLKFLEEADSFHYPYVWIKVNTGMNRLGFPAETLSDVYQRLQNIKGIQQIKGVMTHFASADEIDNPATSEQIYLFDEITKDMPIEKSLANSAGIIAWTGAQADWVRPGIMLYGVSPFADKTGEQLGLKPAMTLKSQIIAMNHCKKGDKVGYNGIYQCDEDMPVGVVAIGYGDGYPRYLREKTPVLVNGIETEVIGRVSMDMITVDLRPIKNTAIGDPVILWGKGLPVECIAQAAHTSPYELLTGVTSRIVYL